MTVAIPGALSPSSSAFRDGAFVLTFGKSGFGKTTDLIASFPMALIVGGTREYKSSITVLGWEPPFREVAFTVFELEDRIDAFLKLRKERNVGALMVNAVISDDFTVMGYHTEKALRQPGGVKHQGKTVTPDLKNYSGVWTAVQMAVLEITFRMAEKLRQEGLHFVVNGHLRQMRLNAAGKPYRGGIDLPMDLTEAVCAGTNVCAMIVEEQDRLFQPTVFNIKNGDQTWATKNQLGLPAVVPANTREMLNVAGYKLKRATGLDAHEDFVEALAQYVSSAFAASPNAAWSKVNLQGVLRGVVGDLAQRVPDPRHFRWIVRDAVDRAQFRMLKQTAIYSEVGL